jgi:hypothetical protein
MAVWRVDFGQPAQEAPMVTDVIKRLRDVFAFALLAVAASYLVSALSLLFSSSQIGEPFSYRAGLFGYLFTVPILLLSLVGAVLLAAGFGEPSRRAKVVVVAALTIGGSALLFGLICWVTSLGADNSFGPVLRDTKFASLLLALAKLGLLALVLVFAYAVLSRLPKRAPLTQQPWGGQQGYGPQPQYPGGQAYAPYAHPGQGYGPPPGTQPSWVQPPPQQHWAQPPDQAWSPPAPGHPPWGPPVESPQWGSPPVHPDWAGPTGSGAQTWGQPTPDQPGWGDYAAGTEPADHPTPPGATAADQVPAEPADPAGATPDEGAEPHS